MRKDHCDLGQTRKGKTMEKIKRWVGRLRQRYQRLDPYWIEVRRLREMEKQRRRRNRNREVEYPVIHPNGEIIMLPMAGVRKNVKTVGKAPKPRTARGESGERVTLPPPEVPKNVRIKER